MGYPATPMFLFTKKCHLHYIFFMILILLTALLWIKHIDLDAMLMVAQQKWNAGQINFLGQAQKIH